nr:inositol monophosphatase [Lautropia sp.]
MTPTLAQLDATADLLLVVADRQILPHFRRLNARDVRTKSSAIDFVTDADEAAERML